MSDLEIVKKYKLVPSERDLKYGRMVREARIKKGFTQKELGQKVGKSNVHISEIERGVKFGSRFTPRGDTVGDIAFDLQMDCEESLIAARCPEAIDILEFRLSFAKRELDRMKKEVKIWVFTGVALGIMFSGAALALQRVLS